MKVVELVRRPRFWVILTVAGCLLAVAPRALTWFAYRNVIYDRVEDVPVENSPRVAIVFGAGLSSHREPSAVLYDRIATAADLYRAGRVRKLLLTGDNRFVNYNEPEAMKAAAMRLGVPEQDLVLDFAGRSTYDSCYRAREIFEVKRAILVTQAFHLDRAMYLCGALGIDAIGIPADRREYEESAMLWWQMREIPATMTAVINVYVWRPAPLLGEKMPIDAGGETARS